MGTGLLWIPVTLVASGLQVARNAMQRELIEAIGTVGATQVRFLYGLPFAALVFGAILWATGEALPSSGPGFPSYLLLGSITQVLATAAMLAAMRGRSFAVVTAILKTEPVQVAVFGLLVLGDPLTPGMLGAITVASAGVVLVSVRDPGGLAGAGPAPILLGLAAGALFALSAITFRGAILGLGSGSLPVRASATLVLSLGVQSAILLAWMVLFDRRALIGSLVAWRRSLPAGFLGALGSQFWFLGFALTSAANVRTLGLIEVVMAQGVAALLFKQRVSRRELAGMGLIVAGVAALLVGQGVFGTPTPPARAP